jgi:hypothetical protein
MNIEDHIWEFAVGLATGLTLLFVIQDSVSTVLACGYAAGSMYVLHWCGL